MIGRLIWQNLTISELEARFEELEMRWKKAQADFDSIPSAERTEGQVQAFEHEFQAFSKEARGIAMAIEERKARRS